VTPSGARGGRRLVVEADGGSRGNPGVAGYGAVVRDADTKDLLVELAKPLGTASNNVAEYSGLIAGLEAAAAIDPAARIEARLDSRLVVEQMSGRWKIKHDDMRRLAQKARRLCEHVEQAGGSVHFTWVPREANRDADALSNDGMDGKTIRRVHEPTPQPPAAVAEREPLRLVLVQALAGDRGEHQVAAAVKRLVAAAPTSVVSATDKKALRLAAVIADALDAEAEPADDWDAPNGEEGADARVRAAYDVLAGRGGTAVVVTSRRGVLTVANAVLGIPDDRFWALATAPGSLTGVEVWADGTASVAFTNRTDHLG
jgi:probable phosphoglycerate mutase